MTRTVFDHLLDEARRVHDADPRLTEFCPFPDDIRPQPVTPFHIPASDLMQNDPALSTPRFAPLRDAFIAAAPHAQWRETYKGTDIGEDFMTRFGCYCLIGDGGPFHSDQMRAWVVYMPAHLHYPWHHHPGEEAYLILAGQAEFARGDEAPETLYPGDIVCHESNQPHATDTTHAPLLAYVVWRNGFDTAPVLTPSETPT